MLHLLLCCALSLPAPTGPFAVGRLTLPPQGARPILLHVWYPAEGPDGAAAPYLEGIGDDPIFARSYAFAGLERLRDVRPHAIANAAMKDGRRPLILFSHGLGMVSFLYSSLLEELASHGYIVVGVEHPGFSAALQMPDGRIVKNESRRPWFSGEPTPEQQAELLRIREEEAIVQAEDLRFALTTLRAAPFAKRIDFRSVGVFGHSRGGFAAAHACFADDRFDACLNLDGYVLTRAVMDRGLRQPYMHVEETGPSTAEETREQRSTFGRMRGGMYHVLVEDPAHASFSDSPYLAPEKYPNIKIDAARALAITRSYVLAFFDRHLKGRAAPLLDGPAAEYPEATLAIYRPKS